MLFWRDGEVHTSSRGGQDYDVATTHIRTDPFVVSLLSKNQNLILDGEIYKHGWPLSKISGLCRLETLHEDHQQLKFHCYDIVDETLSFKDRYKKLTEILENKKQVFPSSRLVIVPHQECKNNAEIQAAHDYWVSQGYEGLVVRDPDEKYKCGARDRRMQKVKLFTDDEYKILDLVEGLREEDMCFLMETKEGYQFKAKPIGDRQLKQWYRDNINDIKGKFGTVKHFGMTTTDKPVPNLPIFKAIRDGKDI